MRSKYYVSFFTINQILLHIDVNGVSLFLQPNLGCSYSVELMDVLD